MTSGDGGLEAAFARALELDCVGRADYLAQLSASDPHLHRRLSALLARDEALSADDASPADPLLAAQAACARVAVPEVEGYVLGEEIGHGGMGVVYRARRHGQGFDQTVAIKLLHPGAVHPAERRRFLSEVRILARLQHPSIARFIDAGVALDGRPFVAMEYIGGLPIDEWCDRQRLSVQDRIELVRQLLPAIQHAHAQLVVHRDIKPGNVLVDAAGRAVLVDFGIASRLDATPPPGGDTGRFMTPRWAAPEQLAGESATVACDIHAVGLLLYWLLCGHEAFELDGLTPGEAERRVLDHAVASMAGRIGQDDGGRARRRACGSAGELRRQLRGDIDRVVLRCLRKHPAERYQSAAELDHDLQAVLTRRPIGSRQNERWYRLRRFAARNRLALSLSAVLLTTLLTAIAVVARQNARLMMERDLSRSATELLQEAFRAANPTGLTGAGTQVRQVLRAARPPLEARYEAQPALYAAMATTLAEVEFDSGRYAESQELAERAQSAAARAGLPGSRRAHLDYLRARAAAVAGDAATAGSLLGEATPEQQALPQWRLIAARLAYQSGRPQEAIATLEQALVSVAGRQAPDPVALEVRLQLAQALRLTGDAARSLAVLDQTVAWQRRVLPEAHPQILVTRQHRLLPMLATLGPVEVQRQAADLLPDLEQAFGPDSAMAAAVHTLLAQSHGQAGDREAALDHYQRALVAWRAAAGPVHPNTLRVAHNLAFRLAQEGDRDHEAEALYREVVVLGRQTLGASDHVVLFWTSSLMQFLRDRRRAAEALELLEPLRGQKAPKLRLPTRRLLLDELDHAGRALGCEAAERGAPACRDLARLHDHLKRS